MRIKVLGSAAGGGLPQWNCSCGNCSAARAGTIPRRHVASLAVTGDETQWVLVNASGDIGAQLAATRELAPQAKRRSPVGTLALTDANIDHVAGLLEFRQAGELSIYSSALVKETLCASPMFAQFGARFAWHGFEARDGPLCVAGGIGGLSIWAIAVPGRLPSYAGGAIAHGAAVAYRFVQGDRRVLYAPIFLDVDAALEREVADADAIFLDGTCWSDDEMVTLGLGPRTAREMGHAPMTGPGGSLERVRTSRARERYYTHVNNSNPILDPASAARRELTGAGFAVCDDGLVISI